jgi:hypothetical protein
MSAAAVGREYLRARADVPAPQTLVTEIASRIPELDGLVSRGSLDTIRAAVDEAVRSDFAAEEVVRVRGWILASTEARVCGLVALAIDRDGPYRARR